MPGIGEEVSVEGFTGKCLYNGLLQLACGSDSWFVVRNITAHVHNSSYGIHHRTLLILIPSNQIVNCALLFE